MVVGTSLIPDTVMSLSQTALIGYLTTIKECAIEIEKHLASLRRLL